MKRFLLNILLLSSVSSAQVENRLKFYPLHIGDFWQYRGTKTTMDRPDPDTTWICTREILGDTIMANGKKYYQVSENKINNPDQLSPYNFFMRLDSLNGNIYQYIGNQEYIRDSLFVEDSAKIFYEYTCFFDVKEFFGLNLRTRLIKRTAISSDYYNGWEYAEGLGETFRYFDDIFVYAIHYISELAYAKINGVEYGTYVSVKDEKEKLPAGYSISQNYPNPFNPTTTIEYSIHTPTFGVPSREGNQRGVFVTLKVYDILGREVATLVNEYQLPGKYSVLYNVETRHGASLPSGVYFYTLMIRDALHSSAFNKTKKCC
ncbi:MAG: hypothetical protein AB1521_01710 [Bacteroidota bacterium]